MHLYGRAYADANPLHRRCREALDRLAAQTNATAQLCALRGNKYVVVDVRDGSGVFRITTDIGVEVPIPWTASGRLLLDHMPAGEILQFVPGEDFRLPDGRLVDADDFVADIARARADGCCMTNGLSDRFTCCLAAPVRDRSGVAVATHCFIVPIDTPEPRKQELLDMLGGGNGRAVGSLNPGVASRLPHLAARRDRPDDLDLAVADAVDLVDHVGDDAAMVGDDVDDLADLRASLPTPKGRSCRAPPRALATTASGYSTTRPKFFT